MPHQRTVRRDTGTRTIRRREKTKALQTVNTLFHQLINFSKSLFHFTPFTHRNNTLWCFILSPKSVEPLNSNEIECYTHTARYVSLMKNEQSVRRD